MKRLILILIIISACQKDNENIQELTWQLFESPNALPLDQPLRNNMEGIYLFSDGRDIFGDEAALKWTYTIEGTDTIFRMSVFCPKEISYMICEGKRIDSTILLSGQWKSMLTATTGNVRLTIEPSAGGIKLLNHDSIAENDILISGVFGVANSVPDKYISLIYNRHLYTATPFIRLAHRGGGRNADLPEASENSIEMMKSASSFGATGIEIDVRLTSDNVPIIYHDETLNERTVRSSGMIGPIANYSYEQLNDLVRLINGEKIPTLREALETVVYHTPLEFVWLDMKNNDAMALARALQIEYSSKAIVAGRNLEIMIGIPETAVNSFLSLSDHEQAPSVCEPEADVEQTNAKIWGASWVGGLQNDVVNAMHARGKRVIVWTIDDPQFTDQFIQDGNFDGILTNYPSYLAYKYYAHE